MNDIELRSEILQTFHKTFLYFGYESLTIEETEAAMILALHGDHSTNVIASFIYSYLHDEYKHLLKECERLFKDQQGDQAGPDQDAPEGDQAGPDQAPAPKADNIKKLALPSLRPKVKHWTNPNTTEIENQNLWDKENDPKNKDV